MSVHLTTLADASLTVAVSRDGSQSLAEGVRERLTRVPAVESVEDASLDGVQPGLNELTAEVTATLAVDPEYAPDAAALADHLAEPFAVSDVTVTALREDSADPPDEVADPV
ncbi:hypothetical protein RYH80_01070 [Halobaculum sp. MBLA0147]|uniref:hypothetical protein n=1 Tax=Halobaculum sp. MBLA0147 TaxID=3079934 RepID=UPI003523AB65